MTLLFGVYSALGTIISYLADPYYNLNEITYIGIVFLLAGVIGSILMGILLDKFTCYRKALIWLTFQSILAQAALFYSLPARNLPIILINACILGASLLPVGVIAATLGAEITFPMHESLSAGYIGTCSTFLSALISYITSYLCWLGTV